MSQAANSVSGIRPGNADGESAAILRAAVRAAGVGRHTEAVALLDGALAGHPDDVDLRQNLALILALAGRRDQAIPHLQRVLAAQPQAEKAAMTLGGLQTEAGAYADAIATYESFLRSQPCHVGASKALGLLLVALGRSVEAVRHLETALDARADDADIMNALGTALRANKDNSRAAVFFERAAAAAPDWLPPRRNLGETLHALGRFGEARAAFTAGLALSPDDAVSLCGLAKVEDAEGHPDAAEALFQRALGYDAHDVDTLYQLGLFLRKKRDHARAIEVLERAGALAPQFVEVWNALGTVYNAAKQPAEAVVAYEKALALDPNDVSTLNNFGTHYFYAAAYEPAAALFERAIALDPGFAEAHYNLGKVRYRTGGYRDAEQSFETAIRLDPKVAMAYVDLAVIRRDLGDFDQALAAIAQGLEALPDDIDLLRVQAVLEFEAGNDQAAQRLAERLVALYPDTVLAHLTWAQVQGPNGSHEDQIAHLEAARAIDPDDTEVLMTLGSVYQALWRSDDAYAIFSRVVELDPKHATALGQAVDAALSLGRWDRYDELKDWLLRLADDADASPESGRVLVFSLQAMPVGYEKIAGAARRSAAAMVPAAPPVRVFSGRPAGKRPRVGFILPYTTWHSLPMVLKPVVEALDRDRIEVWGYGTANGENTDFAKAYQAAFDRYTLVPGNKPDLAAERIAGDHVDILFDVSGHTSRTCLPVLAHRAAPVQIHGLGYSITTGASFVDYLLTDRHFMPPSLARHNSEAGVFMPHSFMIAPPIERRPTPSRRAMQLPETAFVFSNFNHPCKFEPVVFAAWMRILARAPNAVMWFGEFVAATAANLKREAERHGIDPTRLVFAPKIQREDHCARLSAADMALDTYYHGGGITTVDALWAGVPLLSIAGETPAARMGATLLHAVGMPELLCRDLAEYEARAVAFANDPAAVAALRAKLAATIASAPLFDVPRYARDLASAFEVMWRNHWDGRPVAPIEVPV